MLDICFPKYWNAEDGRFEYYWGLLQTYALYGTHNSVPALLQHMVGWKQLQGVVSSVLLNFIPIPLSVASIPLRIAMSGVLNMQNELLNSVVSRNTNKNSSRVFRLQSISLSPNLQSERVTDESRATIEHALAPSAAFIGARCSPLASRGWVHIPLNQEFGK